MAKTVTLLPPAHPASAPAPGGAIVAVSAPAAAGAPAFWAQASGGEKLALVGGAAGVALLVFFALRGRRRR